MAINRPSIIQQEQKQKVRKGRSGGGQIGQALGAVVGGVAGGMAGTVAAPGAGTVAGAIGGASAGGALGQTIGNAVDPAKQDEFVAMKRRMLAEPPEVQQSRLVDAIKATAQLPPDQQQQYGPKLVEALVKLQTQKNSNGGVA